MNFSGLRIQKTSKGKSGAATSLNNASNSEGARIAGLACLNKTLRSNSQFLGVSLSQFAYLYRAPRWAPFHVIRSAAALKLSNRTPSPCSTPATPELLIFLASFQIKSDKSKPPLKDPRWHVETKASSTACTIYHPLLRICQNTLVSVRN